MTEVEKNIADGNLTQKEIIQLLLHNAQHMATREEVKSDILRLEDKVINLATREELSKVEATLKEDISKVEATLKEDISKVEATLKEDNKELSKRMDRFMFWSLGLTITSTFLILGLIYKTIP